ncbi:MAG: DUF6671 family protein [Chloroflexota bacterium]
MSNPVTPEPSPFSGRRAAFGTMHGKERVVAPALAGGLGIAVAVPEGLDTDRFGTFTRDIARAGDQIAAARAKAAAAMDLLGLDLGLASEGSFGPHPAVPWMQANLEVLLLVDRREGIEVVGRHLTTEVAAAGAWAASPGEAAAWAAQAGFPAHALVVRPDPDEPGGIVKGIADAVSLEGEVVRLLASRPRVWLETDLRADRNPTRMQAIAAAAADLVACARVRCPGCAAPGFAASGTVPGLPCGWCGAPTELALAVVRTCARCGASREEPRDDGRSHADPGECPYCNP